MITGKRYIVTKQSDDGTFELGEHIKLENDGDICCFEAQGWIDSEDVPEAIKGMEYEIDAEYYERVKQKLEALLK